MFRRFYVQKVLCSENICSKGSMFRRFYIQKVLCSEGSMFRRSYIQKVLCSEGPMFRKKLFKRSYIQKVLCSEGPKFRYIQKVLYSENSLFYVEKNLHLLVSGRTCNARSQITASHFSSFGQRSDELLSCRVVRRLSVHNLPKSLLDFNQHSEQPPTRSDHRRIVPPIQEYDTPVDLLISACSNFREYLTLGLFTFVVLL